MHSDLTLQSGQSTLCKPVCSNSIIALVTHELSRKQMLHVVYVFKEPKLWFIYFLSIYLYIIIIISDYEYNLSSASAKTEVDILTDY